MHGVADVDALVGRKPPGPLDAVLGGAVAILGQQAAKLRETYPAHLDGDGHQIRQRFGLALSQAETYTRDPEHGFHAVHGGSLR